MKRTVTDRADAARETLQKIRTNPTLVARTTAARDAVQKACLLYTSPSPRDS